MWRKVFENRYCHIDEHTDSPVLRFSRNSTPFESSAAVQRSFTEAAAVLDGLGRERHVLLVDLRRAPPRNDPEFEQAMAAMRKRMLEGFSRSAVLVQTAAGALQVRRHQRDDRAERSATFQDEGAAMAFLLGGGQSPPV